MLGQLFEVPGPIATGQDAAVDGGVDRLDPSIEDFREAREVAEATDGDAGGGEGGVSAAGAVELGAQGLKPSGEIDQTPFIEDAEQCARYGALGDRLPSECGVVDRTKIAGGKG